MSTMSAPGDNTSERYTIRRKIFKIFGAAFHVYDSNGTMVGYCKQKAFRLREDIRLFTNESQQTELFRLKARTMLDFGTTYDLMLADGQSLGSLRRKGLKSSFVRDEWLIFDNSGAQTAMVHETNTLLALARRWIELIAAFFPQRYQVVRTGDNQPLATYRQHFNPFIYKMGVTIHFEDDQFDDLLLLAAACLITAIEGRQS